MYVISIWLCTMTAWLDDRPYQRVEAFQTQSVCLEFCDKAVGFHQDKESPSKIDEEPLRNKGTNGYLQALTVSNKNMSSRPSRLYFTGRKATGEPNRPDVPI